MKRLQTFFLISILGLAFGCAPFFEKPRDYSTTFKLYSEKRKELRNTILSRDFERAIDQCLELRRIFGPDAFTQEIALLCASSLAKEGMLKEAVDVIEEATHDLETSSDLIHLKAAIAELYLQQGQRQKALSVYEELTDALDENKAIVHSLSRKITATRGAEPEPPDDKGEVQVEELSSQLFQEVEQLIQERKFDKARALLLQKRKQLRSAADLAAIEDALNSLAQAEEEFVAHKISMISQREKTLQLSRRLIEEEEFEEAISNLAALEREQGYSHDIKEMKEQAVEGLINRERNRAAKFFLTAKKTRDPLKKEEHLRSSYEILKALVEKYPSSNLNQKIKAHIKVVEEELDKL